MRNIILVVKNEIITNVGKRSFWIMTILFPAFILVFSLGSQVIARTAFEDSPESASPGAAIEATGYVDKTGLIREKPPGFQEGMLIEYPDEESALLALQAGELQRYYIVPEDYIESGRLVSVEADFSPFSAMQDGRFEYVINYNLVGESELASLIDRPTANIRIESLAPETLRDMRDPLTFIVPFATMFIFFFVLTMGSGFMLQSVSREKENRVVEMLLVSINPRQLMMGKILGLSVVALIQMAVWLGGGMLALGWGRQVMDFAGLISLPPGFLVWSLLYFFLGYLTYASLMGAIGALAPNVREGSQFTIIVLLPLMLPVWFNTALIQTPNGPLALFLSLFPLTAPTSMMTRLVATDVPVWQILIGLALLAATAYLFITLAARFFRADTLLSDTALQWRRVVSEFRK